MKTLILLGVLFAQNSMALIVGPITNQNAGAQTLCANGFQSGTVKLNRVVKIDYLMVGQEDFVDVYSQGGVVSGVANSNFLRVRFKVISRDFSNGSTDEQRRSQLSKTCEDNARTAMALGKPLIFTEAGPATGFNVSSPTMMAMIANGTGPLPPPQTCLFIIQTSAFVTLPAGNCAVGDLQ